MLGVSDLLLLLRACDSATETAGYRLLLSGRGNSRRMPYGRPWGECTTVFEHRPALYINPAFLRPHCLLAFALCLTCFSLVALPSP